MKSILFFFLLTVSFSNCRSQKNEIEEVIPVELSGCKDSKYTRASELKGLETRVVKSKDSNVFLIEQPDVKIGFAAPWIACNLPESFKKDNLRIRFDGFVLTYPGMENENSLGNPIELTKIELSSGPF